MCEIKPKKTKHGRRKFQKRLSKSKGHNETLHGSTRSTCVYDLAYGKFGVRVGYVKSNAGLPSASKNGRGGVKIQSSDLPYVSCKIDGTYNTSETSKAGRIRISAAEIQSLHRELTRRLRPYGRVWRRIFPDVGVSSKPAEVKMGKSKGGVSYWCSKFQPGKIAFELDGISEAIARQTIRCVHKKSRFSLQLVKSDSR